MAESTLAVLRRDASFSALVAGFVTVLVGFTSSAVIVFQAATALGASQAEAASWMWALGFGMGLSTLGLSLRYRMPVVIAWSTPAAAMLITSTAGISLAEATGAFLLTAVMVSVAGFSGLFERAISRLPLALASAILAGLLLRFGLELFAVMPRNAWLAAGMCAAYLLLKRWQPRYAVLGALVSGMLVAGMQGKLHLHGVPLALTAPVFTMPVFSLPVFLGLALPMFIVTMASQTLPGVAIARASGFPAPVSPVVGWMGAVNVLFSVFGAFSLGLAAISAAICMGPEAHEEKGRRYVAAVSAGFFYFLIGVFGATVAAVFAAFPRELVVILAGLALLGTIGNGLVSALAQEADREAALITFLVTASGFSLWGVSSAFWGLVAGVLVLLVLRGRLANLLPAWGRRATETEKA